MTSFITTGPDLYGEFVFNFRGGRVVRWCWVNFLCRGDLPFWIVVGQGPTVLAVSAGGGCFDIFSLVYHFAFLSPSFWETVVVVDLLICCLTSTVNIEGHVGTVS